jgi:hypothetical protein
MFFAMKNACSSRVGSVCCPVGGFRYENPYQGLLTAGGSVVPYQRPCHDEQKMRGWESAFLKRSSV